MTSLHSLDTRRTASLSNRYAGGISAHTSKPSRSAQYRYRGSATFWCLRTPLNPRFGQLHVASQGVVVGRGETALGPVALVEDESQGKWAPIEHEPAFSHTDGAQGRVAAYFVDRRAAGVDDLEYCVDQHGVLRRPPQGISQGVEAGAIEHKGPLQTLAGHRDQIADQLPVADRQSDP